MTGEFPSLENLRIGFFPMSIINFRAPNLRNLKLLGDFDFDLEIILDVLESSPLLETLGLDFREDVSVISTGRMVRLKKVKQADFSWNGFKILQHLLLPTSKDIVINIEPRLDRLLGTMVACAPLLSQALDSLPPLRQVQSVSFHPEGLMKRSAFIEGPHGTVELLTNTDPATFVTILRVFTERSTESIQELKLSNVDSPYICLARDIFKSSGNLRSVSVHGPCISECFFLVGTSHCLQLEELTARDPDYVALEFFVQRRSKAGIPIQRLVLESHPNTQVDMETVERLRKYVGDVREVRGYSK